MGQENSKISVEDNTDHTDHTDQLTVTDQIGEQSGAGAGAGAGAMQLSVEKLTINSFFKNNCPPDEDYYWLYSSLTEDSWWFMDKSEADLVESLYSGSTALSTNAPCRFAYDFSTMTQKGTHNTRRIYRLTRREYLSLRNEYIETILKRQELWVCDCDTYYRIYSPEIQTMLDDADENAFTVSLGNGFEYRFDMTSRSQQNTRSSRVRSFTLLDPRSSENSKPIIGSFGFQYS